MLELFKSHLINGMEIVKVKKKASEYIITTLYKGNEHVTYLHKTCAYGRHNHLVHQAFCNILASAAIDADDYETSRKWLDRNMDFTKWAWEYDDI